MNIATGLLAMILLSGTAQAHTRMQSSMPADKSVLTAAQDHVMLTFSEAATVTALTLQKGTDAPRALSPLPGKATREVMVSLPVLAPGDYVVSWRAAGGDNHIMSGKFSFTVKAPTSAVARP